MSRLCKKLFFYINLAVIAYFCKKIGKIRNLQCEFSKTLYHDHCHHFGFGHTVLSFL